MNEWLEAAREVKKQAVASGSADVFFQPLFPGKPWQIKYTDFTLVDDLDAKMALKLKKSHVPYNIRGNYRNWGGKEPKQLLINGTIVKSALGVSRFVATGVEIPNKAATHNQITVLNLLQARGFITPMAFSGWMPTDEVCRSALTARLDLINRSIAAAKGLRFTPVPSVGIALFDCIGFK